MNGDFVIDMVIDDASRTRLRALNQQNLQSSINNESPNQRSLITLVLLGSDARDRHLQLDALALSVDADGSGAVDFRIGDQAAQMRGILHRRAVEADDHVAGAQARLERGQIGSAS